MDNQDWVSVNVVLSEVFVNIPMHAMNNTPTTISFVNLNNKQTKETTGFFEEEKKSHVLTKQCSKLKGQETFQTLKFTTYN